jgi:hypothetical protein
MASTLTGNSTDSQVWKAYDDNASYEEDGSRAKALAFMTACRILLRRTPTRSEQNGEVVEFDQVRISGELDSARNWLVRNPARGTCRTRFASLSDFRDETGG